MAKAGYRPDELILNSPFEEPSRYWEYQRQHMWFDPRDGRRPAGYMVASPEAQGHDDPGRFVELPLVNQIRPRVKSWREAGRPGVTGVTRRLLEHWFPDDPGEAELAREGARFFFCQQEAIETLIWLAEAPPAETQGVDVPTDGGPFDRWCTKLATGGGKTVVMAMLIAWQTLNKVAYPQDARFGKNILIVAPGLTVRDRLQVLVPDSPDNYYDEFQVVPHGLEEMLRQGRVLIHNWHALDWQTAEQLEKVRSVDRTRRTPKSDEAWVRDVLGDAARSRNFIVINDEAHHAWRAPAGETIRGVSKADRDEATKWVGALDRLHRVRGVGRCFDFSATPYAPSGKASSEEALFGWIVSDFGLNDAIESGLVKTPRVVVRDNGRLDAEYKSRFHHLYRDPDVTDDLNRRAEAHEPLPQLVTVGYNLLGADWLETAREWERQGHPTPPAMITVANRTETAARIKYAFDHEKIEVPELCDADRTLHIDSKVLQKAEQQDEAVALASDDSASDDEEDDGPVRKLTKQQQAELLRRMVDTVGRPGREGADVQNVISVGMLSEGWDAKTVTHIMGLRAFTSQLLCEQVVGRGLRRTSYELNDQGRFDPEYVNIFGVPFTFLPHEDGGTTPPPPTKPKTLIEPIRSREGRYGLVWPNVLRVEHVYEPRLSLDLEAVDVLELRASDTPTHAELAATLEGKPDLTLMSQIDLEELGRRNRMQTIVFKTARDVYDQMQKPWKGSKESLLAQVIRLVEGALDSDVVRIKPESFGKDPLKRRILLTLNMSKVVHHVCEAIRFENTSRIEPVFDPSRPILSTADMRPWWTSRPCHPTEKSHVNIAVYDSRWEASEAYELDRSELVDAWVKNDHLGFEIVYIHQGVVRKYRPDFLIRLTNGATLILEVKGRETDEVRTKHRFLEEWVEAVNAHGGFGRWMWAVSREIDDLPDILARQAIQ